MGKIVFRIAIDVMNASFHLFPLAYSVQRQHNTKQINLFQNNNSSHIVLNLRKNCLAK